MELKLNCSPNLTMSEITKQLFNCKFLSDIQFVVEGKIIYAHSLELMKRSIVFEKVLQNECGNKKIIPMVACSYESFLEFMRFIYTDDCVINERNGIDILKLATVYKVIMLENKVINKMDTIKWGIQLYDHCIVDNYKFVRHFCDHQFAFNLAERLEDHQFLLLQPEALYALLKLDKIARGVTEFQLFVGLGKWITHHCNIYQLPLTEGRRRFHHLIQLIRFPTMPMIEIRICGLLYPELLNESDLSSIELQMSRKNIGFISRKRGYCEPQFVWKSNPSNKKYHSTVTVKRVIILSGLWIGIGKGREDIEVEIKAEQPNLAHNKQQPNLAHMNNTILFKQAAPLLSNKLAISLGNSICLKPNFEYTIVIKYLKLDRGYNEIFCRNNFKPVIYNNPWKAVQKMIASENLLELLFTLPGA